MVFFLAVLQQMARVICMTRMIQFHRYSRIQTFELWELQREIIVVRNRYVLNPFYIFHVVYFTLTDD